MLRHLEALDGGVVDPHDKVVRIDLPPEAHASDDAPVRHERAARDGGARARRAAENILSGREGDDGMSQEEKRGRLLPGFA